ncbi:MAG: hypothetical protein EOM68_14840 [Spirochaetia bacterium]|nr:hypothetical protein [Spirochaetia bacterium]
MYIADITDTQSARLTKAVLLAQKQKDNQVLHDKVHLVTQQLLYTLPSRLRLLPEEDCCEFLFYCYETIEHYLASYREGKLPYVGYITEVVRKRSRYFMAYKRIQRNKERALLESEQSLWDESEDASCVAESQSYTPLSGIATVENSVMPSLFEQLLNAPKSNGFDHVQLDEVQKRLQKRLQQGVNRKRFLIMLAISPHLTNLYLLEEIATLLEVDARLLNRFLSTAELQLEQKKQCKLQMEGTSNRHFRRIMEIQAELNGCVNEQKRADLMALLSWTERVHRTKVEQIRKLEYHLSHSQISLLLGVPKGTVASSVHYIKTLIKECMD